MTDRDNQPEAEAATEKPYDEPLTHDEMCRLTKELEKKIARHSKTTLVVMLACETVSGAWASSGSRKGIADSSEQLLKRLDRWAPLGRDINRSRRLDRLLQRLEATAGGRSAPKRKTRRKAR